MKYKANPALTGHRFPVYSIAVTSDGKYAVSASYGLLVFWDLANMRAISIFPEYSWQGSIYDLPELELELMSQEVKPNFISVEISDNDVRMVVLSDHNIIFEFQLSKGLYNIQNVGATGFLHFILTDYSLADLQAPYQYVKFSPDNVHFALALDSVFIYQIRKKPYQHILKNDIYYAQTVAYNKKGDLLFSGWSDGSLVIYETVEYKQIKKIIFDSGTIHSIQFLHEKELILIGCDDGSIYVLDKNYKIQNSIQAHRGCIDTMKPFSGSDYFASLGSDDSVKIWETKNFTEIDEIKSSSTIKCNAITPDGKILLIGDQAGNIQVYTPYD